MRVEDVQQLIQTISAPLASLFLRRPGRARVYNSVDFSVPNATTTTLTFNSERIDTADFHSTVSNTSRLTVPVDGWYFIGAHVRYAPNITGTRLMYIQNTSTGALVGVDSQNARTAAATDLNVTTLYSATAGQYFEVLTYQDSGGALNIESNFAYSPDFWIIGPV